jgi:diguanylate cyclase (GGDEF)-like protein
MRSMLIVDRSEIVAMLFAELFEAEGWRVAVCHAGECARDRLNGNDPFDVILLSYRVPGTDGVKLIRFIRTLEHRRLTAVVMVTGSADGQLSAEALAAGADEVLFKPVDPVALVCAVEKRYEFDLRTRQTTLLAEMVDLLQSCLSAGEAYAVIRAFMPKLFPSESGFLGVLGASGNLVEVVASWGDPPPGDQFFGPDRCWALRRGRPYRVDVAGSELVCGHLDPSLPAGYICVPMMAHAEPLGVLHVQEGSSGPGRIDRGPGPLRATQRRLPVTVAERIALPLANLRLREHLRSQSILDPLTELFNRRYMEETLDLELIRAARGRRAVGIIMLDIDHFKPLNDSCGHDAGDALLRELAGLFKTRVRGGDIACRHGGDEFVLILPEASLDLTRCRAEELLEAVRQLHVSQGGRVIGPITVSAGVAAFPDHGRTRAALLHAADTALYRAKDEGGDQVIVAR